MSRHATTHSRRSWCVHVVVLSVVLSGACGETQPSRVLVVIDAEPGVRTRTREVVVSVWGGESEPPTESGIPLEETFAMRMSGESPGYDWPLRVLLRPRDGGDRTYRVRVRAYDSSDAARPDTAVVAETRAINRYLRGEVRQLSMVLLDACAGTRCAVDERCVASGRCDPLQEDPLGPVVMDGGVSPVDAGRDAPTNDAPENDSGPEVFTPRNLPDDTFARASGEIEVLTSATIDTTTGSIVVDGRAVTGVTTLDVDATGDCGGIFVIAASRFFVREGAVVNVTGTRSLAIAVAGDLEVAGTLDLRARGSSPGPGSLRRSPGGAYGSSAGLRGGCPTGEGGVSGYGDALLVGLCGGSQDGDLGGGGGGAVSLASTTAVRVTATGQVAAMGGGGRVPAGRGGSGGAVLIQAPSVLIEGVVSVNGGGGAAEVANAGQDGQLSTAARGGATTSMSFACGADVYGGGGQGAWQGGVAQNGASGFRCSSGTCAPGGGGGGGAGRIRVEGDERRYGAGAVLDYPEVLGVFSEGPLR